MIQIAVCDDEAVYIEKISTLISDYFIDKKEKYEIVSYHSGEELLAATGRYSIIFLDIEMEGMDGLETAKRIRENDKQVPIVYVTSHIQYSMKAYTVHPFQYITKPLREEDIKTVFDDYLALLEEKEEKLMFVTENGMETVEVGAICYFIVTDRNKLVMATKETEYIVCEKLSDVYEKLDKHIFYMAHRSAIVNIKHVVRLENGYDIIMSNGQFCPLAQKKKTEFLEILGRNYLGKVKGTNK